MELSKEEQRIKDLAIKNFAQFIVIVGRDTMNCIIARQLRSEGKSYNQIALKTGMTISQVKTAVKKRQIIHPQLKSA